MYVSLSYCTYVHAYVYAHLCMYLCIYTPMHVVCVRMYVCVSLRRPVRLASVMAAGLGLRESGDGRREENSEQAVGFEIKEMRMQRSI